MRGKGQLGHWGLMTTILAFGLVGVLAVVLYGLSSNEPEVADQNQSTMTHFIVAKPASVLEEPTAIPTIDPRYRILYERNILGADLIAEVIVSDIGDVRANSTSGVVPTRDPSLPGGQDRPEPEKELWVPIRLDVVTPLKGLDGSGHPNGLVVLQYTGMAADYGDRLPDSRLDHFVLGELEVGDEGVVMLRWIDRDRPIDLFVQGIVDQLNQQPGGVYAGNVIVDGWYKYATDQVLRTGYLDGSPTRVMPRTSFDELLEDTLGTPTP